MIYIFRKNMGTLRNFAKSVVADIFAKFTYITKQTIYPESQKKRYIIYAHSKSLTFFDLSKIDLSRVV